MEEPKKDLTYYLGLPYTIEVIRDDDEVNPGWVARVVELPGCITQGDTFEELGEMIDDAMRGWIEIALDDNIPVPEPRPQEEYSGKFVVRVPKSLHRELVETADSEGVSLNAFVSASLGKAVGQSIVAPKTKATEIEPMSVVAWPKLRN
jgi:antitoxin HicB